MSARVHPVTCLRSRRRWRRRRLAPNIRAPRTPQAQRRPPTLPVKGGGRTYGGRVSGHALDVPRFPAWATSLTPVIPRHH
eukprot:11511134-Alexandrium_andersonii.AAC.1